MSIIRNTAKKRGFAIIANAPINDARLSWEALGLLTFLLSKPDDWEVMVAHLVNLQRGAGRDKVYKMLAELERAGYLARYRERQADGTFQWIRQVYEDPAHNPIHGRPLTDFQEVDSPLPDLPDLVQPDTVQPDLVKPTLLRTEDEVRTETPRPETEREDPPPSAPEGLEELAEAIAETCGLSAPALKAAKSPAKWNEILDAAAFLSRFPVPVPWFDEPEQAGPITSAHIRGFKDWWQSTRPVGNSEDDLPHVSQLLNRLITERAFRWITARLPVPGQEDLEWEEPFASAPRRLAEDPEAVALWEDVLRELSLSLQRAVFDNWLRRSVGVSLDAETLTVGVHTPQEQEWLRERLNGAITNRVSRLANRDLEVRYQVIF